MSQIEPPPGYKTIYGSFGPAFVPKTIADEQLELTQKIHEQLKEIIILLNYLCQESK